MLGLLARGEGEPARAGPHLERAAAVSEDAALREAATVGSDPERGESYARLGRVVNARAGFDVPTLPPKLRGREH